MQWIILGIQIQPYPMIKCNIAPRDAEKIYHLPMDQQYDKVVIGDNPGECYAHTVKEAEDPASTVESRFYIGQCYIELGENDKAIASFEGVTEVAPKTEWSTRAKAEIKLLKK